MNTRLNIIEIIQNQVAALPPGEALPTDGQLSITYGVSTRTIRRAMAVLSKKGLVCRICGKGTYVGGEPPIETETIITRKPASSANRMADLLTQSISSGDLRVGKEMPQPKYLSLQYHVTLKTIAAAYRILEGRGLAYSVGRRYYAGSFSAKQPRTKVDYVYVIATDPADFVHIFSGDSFASAYRSLEYELNLNGFQTRYSTIDKLESLIAGWKQNASWPTGLIFWNFDVDKTPEVISHTLNPVFGPYSEHTIPILFDLFHVRNLKNIPGWILTLSRGNLNTLRCRSLVQYISRRGIKQVQLIYDADQIFNSPSGGFARFQKITGEILESGQYESIIQTIVCTGNHYDRELLIEKINLDNPTYQEYLNKKYPSYTSDISHDLRVLSSMDELTAEKGSFACLICVTDQLAAQAKKVLSNRGIDIPKEISIITLENSPSYLPHGFTASVVDQNLVGYTMAHAIIGDIPLRKTHKGFIRIDQSVIERLT